MAKRCYYRAGFVVFLAVIAFFALTPKPGLEAGSGAMSMNKFIELGLLMVACIIVTGLVLFGGCRMRLRSGGFFKEESRVCEGTSLTKPLNFRLWIHRIDCLRKTGSLASTPTGDERHYKCN